MIRKIALRIVIGLIVGYLCYFYDFDAYKNEDKYDEPDEM